MHTHRTWKKDLGVIFSADMKFSKKCRIAASKGNQIIGLENHHV